MKQLYCPWRSSYSRDKGRSKQEDTHEDECIFCAQIKADDDEQHLILKRYKHNLIILNKYPYNAGHLMILPFEHVSDLDQLSPEARAEMMELINESVRILHKELKAEGMNIGMNLGKMGGAGIPSHIHMHVVPRFEGDTNFMATIAGTKNISFNLIELFFKLKQHF